MTNTLHRYFSGEPGNSRERIQDLLRERGMSQAELAEKIGLSESSLSRYLNGQTDKLSADNIVAIARVFEVTTDFLLCLTDIPFTTNYDKGLFVHIVIRSEEAGVRASGAVLRPILAEHGVVGKGDLLPVLLSQVGIAPALVPRNTFHTVSSL